jgi:hypothetical protein
MLVTIVSWSSCAKNKVMIDTTIYGLSYPVVSSSILAPTLTAIQTNDNLRYSPNKTSGEHNRFYEFSIVFNENLQQMISFFTHSSNEKSELVKNNFSSYDGNQSTINDCKTNNESDT